MNGMNILIIEWHSILGRNLHSTKLLHFTEFSRNRNFTKQAPREFISLSVWGTYEIWSNKFSGSSFRWAGIYLCKYTQYISLAWKCHDDLILFLSRQTCIIALTHMYKKIDWSISLIYAYICLCDYAKVCMDRIQKDLSR